MKIGFIGLGIMGSRMAANLLKNGYELVIYNRTRAKGEGLMRMGAVWGQSPAEVADQAGVLFTMLSTPEVVDQIALGENGFLRHLKANALWVNCTTVNPSFSRAMAKKAQEHQIRYVDAPVAGSKGAAEAAQLTFFVGGKAKDIEELKPILNAMGQKVVHVGEAGMGSALKIVNNLILGEAMVAFAEALVLGQALGIKLETLLDVLLGGTATAPFLVYKRHMLESGAYEADFPLQWMQKDLQLAAVTAYEQGVALPTVNVAKEVYMLAARNSLGEKDFAAVYAFLNQGEVR